MAMRHVRTSDWVTNDDQGTDVHVGARSSYDFGLNPYGNQAQAELLHREGSSKPNMLLGQGEFVGPDGTVPLPPGCSSERPAERSIGEKILRQMARQSLGPIADVIWPTDAQAPGLDCTDPSPGTLKDLGIPARKAVDGGQDDSCSDKALQEFYRSIERQFDFSDEREQEKLKEECIVGAVPGAIGGTIRGLRGGVYGAGMGAVTGGVTGCLKRVARYKLKGVGKSALRLATDLWKCIPHRQVSPGERGDGLGGEAGDGGPMQEEVQGGGGEAEDESSGTSQEQDV